MASSGTTHLHTLVLHTKSDLSHAHLASVSVSLRFTASQTQYIPSLSSNALFICCFYTHSPSLGTKSCRVYNYRQISLVYRCLTILKPDSFSDFPQAVYSSAQTNNRTVHSPTTKKTHARMRARTHTHTGSKNNVPYWVYCLACFRVSWYLIRGGLPTSKYINYIRMSLWVSDFKGLFCRT